MYHSHISASGNKGGFVLVFFNQGAVQLDDQHAESVVHFLQQSRDGKVFLPFHRVSVDCNGLFVQCNNVLPKYFYIVKITCFVRNAEEISR